MTKKPGFRGGLAAAPLAAVLALALPTLAGAQTVTAHKLDVSLKGVGQMTTGNDDLKEDNFNANEKDLFEICVGRAPTKSEGIYLLIDCVNLENNVIAAINTSPYALIQELGEIDLDSPAISTTKSDSLKSIKVPASVTVTCDDASFDAAGVITVKLKALDDGQECPNTATLKMTGDGSVLDEPFIVDSGSSVSAKKRDGAISTFPPEP